MPHQWFMQCEKGPGKESDRISNLFSFLSNQGLRKSYIPRFDSLFYLESILPSSKRSLQYSSASCLLPKSWLPFSTLFCGDSAGLILTGIRPRPVCGFVGLLRRIYRLEYHGYRRREFCPSVNRTAIVSNVKIPTSSRNLFIVAFDLVLWTPLDWVCW